MRGKSPKTSSGRSFLGCLQKETLLVILNDKLYANNSLGSDREAFQRRAGDGAGPDSDKSADTAPFPERL